MRLIDADALKENLKTDCSFELFDMWGNYKPDARAILDAIDSAPSIQPETKLIAEVKMSKEDIQSAVDEAVEQI